MSQERTITNARYLKDKNLIEVYYDIIESKDRHTIETTPNLKIIITPFSNMTKENLLARIKDKIDGNEDAQIDQIAQSLIGERF